MATKKLYRSRYGMVFGVCQGFADWRDLPVTPVRVIVAATIVCTGIFPGAAIYLLAALLIPMNPYEGARQTTAGYGNSQKGPETAHTVHGTYEAYEEDPRSTDELKSEYERLKKKVEKMEEEMFDKERDWDQRFHEGK